jgi:hypothetical protein
MLTCLLAPTAYYIDYEPGGLQSNRAAPAYFMVRITGWDGGVGRKDLLHRWCEPASKHIMQQFAWHGCKGCEKLRHLVSGMRAGGVPHLPQACMPHVPVTFLP